MTTRKRTEGKPPSQQGYASSTEFERGLLANLVAKRCEVLESAEDRELIFALQHVSHQPGGLKRFARALIDENPQQVVTPAMLRLGFKPGQFYNASQVREVREEISGGGECFLLKGEFTYLESMEEKCKVVHIYDTRLEYPDIPNPEYVAAKAKANARPSRYAAEDFVRCCVGAARDELSEFLEKLCLDPEQPLEGRWYFPNLIATLRSHFANAAEQVSKRVAETAVTRQVFEALDYSLAADGIVLINGLARIGKTYAIKAWCEQRPGVARYVEVPPSNDDGSFYRCIAEALGVSSGLSMKSVQLRERVEKTLKSAKLAMICDEGHYLMGQDYRCRKKPTRICWLMKLANAGVPIAICATPQFDLDKERIKDRVGWAWEQFDGRLGHEEILDTILSLDDLKAVARIHLPDLDEDGIYGVAEYAASSSSYVAGIEHVAKRARYNAQKANRTRVTSKDIVAAIRARTPLDSARRGTVPHTENGKTTTRTGNAVRPSAPPQMNLDRGLQPGQSESRAQQCATALQVT